MKKLLFLTLAILLSLAACSAAHTVTVKTLPSETASPTAIQTPSHSTPYGEEQSYEESLYPSQSPDEVVTPLPSKTPSLLPSPLASSSDLDSTPTQSPEKIKTDPNSVIFASGNAVIGGWSKGKWLTHDKAAAQCRKKKTFYSYNLTGLIGTVKSKGLINIDGDSYEDEDFDERSDFFNKDDGYGNSWSCDYGDIHTFDQYYLNDGDKGGSLFTIPPDKFPSVTLVSDTSAYLPAIQNIINKHLGAKTPKAYIRTAAQCDIDGDGKLETIINADNCEDKVGDEEHNNVYCIACIIEPDGSVNTVYEFYIGSKEEPSNVEYASIDNVIDINGDGKCEIVVGWTEFNAWMTSIYKYDGTKFTKVFSYDLEA